MGKKHPRPEPKPGETEQEYGEPASRRIKPTDTIREDDVLQYREMLKVNRNSSGLCVEQALEVDLSFFRDNLEKIQPEKITSAFLQINKEGFISIEVCVPKEEEEKYYNYIRDCLSYTIYLRDLFAFEHQKKKFFIKLLAKMSPRAAQTQFILLKRILRREVALMPNFVGDIFELCRVTPTERDDDMDVVVVIPKSDFFSKELLPILLTKLRKLPAKIESSDKQITIKVDQEKAKFKKEFEKLLYTRLKPITIEFSSSGQICRGEYYVRIKDPTIYPYENEQLLGNLKYRLNAMSDLYQFAKISNLEDGTIIITWHSAELDDKEEIQQKFDSLKKILQPEFPFDSVSVEDLLKQYDFKWEDDYIVCDVDSSGTYPASFISYRLTQEIKQNRLLDANLLVTIAGNTIKISFLDDRESGLEALESLGVSISEPKIDLMSEDIIRFDSSLSGSPFSKFSALRYRHSMPVSTLPVTDSIDWRSETSSDPMSFVSSDSDDDDDSYEIDSIVDPVERISEVADPYDTFSCS